METEAWKAENDAADIAKSIDTIEGERHEGQRADARAAAGLRRRLARSCSPTFAGLVKDQAFFDKTVAFVGKN